MAAYEMELSDQEPCLGGEGTYAALVYSRIGDRAVRREFYQLGAEPVGFHNELEWVDFVESHLQPRERPNAFAMLVVRHCTKPDVNNGDEPVHEPGVYLESLGRFALARLNSTQEVTAPRTAKWDHSKDVGTVRSVIPGAREFSPVVFMPATRKEIAEHPVGHVLSVPNVHGSSAVYVALRRLERIVWPHDRTVNK